MKERETLVVVNGRKIVIGVDGGGTKTHGILYREDGKVLAEGFFPSSNPHSNPEPKVRDALHTLITTLLKDGGLEIENVDGICLGMAGCDRPADKGLIEKIVREKVGQDTNLLIDNDAVVAITAVLNRLHGILVIAGTGSICFGFHEARDERRRCGGWGHLIADEGSGYLIGLSAIRAIMRSFDGRQQSTSLTGVILEELNLNSPTDLIGWTYVAGNGKMEVAALARFVHEEAGKGDPVASEILNTQADLLLEIIEPVYRGLFSDEKEPTPIALWGGNLIHAKPYQQRVLDLLAKSDMNVEPVIREEKAVVGAAKYMLRNL